MLSHPETVRIIRVFVSSPGDVKEERKALEDVVNSINRIDGDPVRARLELWKWETNAIPQIGPGAQPVIDSQTPAYGIFLGIMKHRFGTPTGSYGSGTEKEFSDALKRWGDVGEPWILFYFCEEEVNPNKLDLRQFEKVQKFRKQVENKGLTVSYKGISGSNDAFVNKVDEHLRKILHKVMPIQPTPPSPTRADCTAYLNHLHSKTAHIDIRGIFTGQKGSHRFPIEDLYISLTTSQPLSAGEEPTKSCDGRMKHDLAESRVQSLDLALQSDRLMVLGDPGAGKTTFIRRIAHVLCETELGASPDAARLRLRLGDRTFPVLVRLSELDEHILRHKREPSAPSIETSPAWLPHFLAAVSRDHSWGLSFDFFQEQLKSGLCTVLFDGLDEAPDRLSRRRLVEWIEAVAGAYEKCRLVVTSRPAGYTGEMRLEGFAHAHIDLLSDEAVRTFLARWCKALYSENPGAADTQCRDLLSALQQRPAIRRLARNAVMLTALAVVAWNQRRLPEQRSDLYESVIHWLSHAREKKSGREKPERAVELLQNLALAMQDDPEGVRNEVPNRWAADRLAGEWSSGPVTAKAIAAASSFLEAEKLDSGIIVGRGDNIQFWHRTFQEFLSARCIAGLPDIGQQELLWRSPPKLYLPEWREVILLLAGVLHRQGRPKVDNLVRTMIDDAGKRATLAEQARCAGLLGTILNDLAPVGYQISDQRYRELLHRVMAVFDVKLSRTVPLADRIAAADALGQAGDPRLNFERDDYWVRIDAGEFWMGAQSTDPKGENYDSEAHEYEGPVHKAYLDSFSIARYPVTVGQYREFVEDGGYEYEKLWINEFGKYTAPDGWEEQLRYPSRPVVDVSWHEASAYCRWAGYRLPSEAEWERAARGKEGNKYPWGKEPPEPYRLNYSKSELGHPTPVGIYPEGATVDGICDLAGNVWEWCVDEYCPYSINALAKSSMPKEASFRVIRGGSWGPVAWNCCSSYRSGLHPSDRILFLGFRVALAGC